MSTDEPDYEQLDRLVDEDPIALRDVAWAKIRSLRRELAEAQARAKGIHLVCQEAELRAEAEALRFERDDMDAYAQRLRGAILARDQVVKAAEEYAKNLRLLLAFKALSTPSAAFLAAVDAYQSSSQPEPGEVGPDA